MPLASIVDPGYKIGLFLHILAVVLAFGPTFGYALFFSVAPQYPHATPAILTGVQKCDKYLVNPGMVVLLLAGFGLLAPTPPGDQRRLRRRRDPRDHRPLRPPARLLPAADAEGEGARRTGPRRPATRSAPSSKRSARGSARSVRWPGSSSSWRSSSWFTSRSYRGRRLPDSDVRLGGRRSHRPSRVPGLAAGRRTSSTSATRSGFPTAPATRVAAGAIERDLRAPCSVKTPPSCS